MSSYKERQTESLRRTQDELIRKIESLPIFRSDQSIAKVQITFAVSEVLDKLALVEWAEPAPFISVEQVALDNLRKEKTETVELEKQNEHANAVPV
jgi:hypothetical protein